VISGAERFHQWPSRPYTAPDAVAITSQKEMKVNQEVTVGTM